MRISGLHLKNFKRFASKELLSVLFRDRRIVFVENKDREYYANVDSENTIFVSENNKNSVFHKAKSGEYYGIIDRDFLNDNDIAVLKKEYSKLYILNYYSIENYLYHPDNLEEYYTSKAILFDKQAYKEELRKEKERVVERICISIKSDRSSYPFFSEPKYNNTPLQKRFKNSDENTGQTVEIATSFKSNDFETFYKLLPMKDYGTQIPQRQNISKNELAKTKWFRQMINEVLI